jgi:Protein of unknown function (DUF3383)
MTINSIPMSQIIGTLPSVLGAGGNELSLNGVLLTTDTSIPIGVAVPFSSSTNVDNWFGVNAPEAILAGNYFEGFTGADSLPGTLYYFQYNETAVSAYLRGGNLTAVPLTALQGFSGGLNVTVDGRALTSANINLASATSYSNAATLIQTGLQTTGNSWSGTLTTNTTTTVTINSTTGGILHIGDILVGTDIPGGATIVSFGTYTTTAGTGTVVINIAATGSVGPEAGSVTYLPTVTYDALRQAFVVTSPTTGVTSSVGFASGSLSADILLTQATSAVQSIGAAAATPTSALNALVASTQNWVSFSHVFSVTTAVALGFALWVSENSPAGQERFIYVEWDADTADDTSNPPSGASFGAQVIAAAYNGVVPIYDLTSGTKAAAVMGWIASIDFTETNGRITFAFKGQAGLVPDVTNAAIADALAGPPPYGNNQGNGYNFYASFGTAAEIFQWFMPGSMPGAWKWLDPYVNQIAMNADFQLALAVLAGSVKSIPYNTAGKNIIRGALSDTITKYLNFGAIQPGVVLSASQIQAVNIAAGMKIDTVLSAVGYYLQILDASPTVRGLRGAPPMNFWYTDGGSVQNLLLATIDVQ